MLKASVASPGGGHVTRLKAETRRALLLINSHARHGAEADEGVERALAQAGMGVLRITCGKRDDLAATIRARAEEVDCVVVGGGDGTLNAVAPALIETGLPLGVIPLGTANDLARTLGLPLDPSEAANVVAAGYEQRVDIGLANEHPFFNVASIGFGVDLTRALTRDAKKRWGALGYAIAGFKVLSRMRPFHAPGSQERMEAAGAPAPHAARHAWALERGSDAGQPGDHGAHAPAPVREHGWRDHDPHARALPHPARGYPHLRAATTDAIG